MNPFDADPLLLVALTVLGLYVLGAILLIASLLRAHTDVVREVDECPWQRQRRALECRR